MNPFLAVAAVAACAYLPLAGRPPSPIRSAIKTLAVAALAVGAIGGPILLVIALTFCALGDFLLSKQGDTAFLQGVAAFAAGHLAFAVLFLDDPTVIFSGWRAFIVVMLFALTIRFGALVAGNAGSLAPFVIVYCPIIFLMAACALSQPGWLIPLAALSFVASDMVLATDKFLVPAGHWASSLAPYVIWPTYWGAQAGFFLAFTSVNSG